MIQYKRHGRFEKQFTKLLGRFKTLEEDLKVVQSAAIELLHERKIDNHSIVLIPGFNNANVKIYKIKKFACKALKGKGARSGIRIIYAFYPATFEIEFLEIYYKDKEDSDMDYGFIRDYTS
jgi:hypothetical protein